MELIRWGTPGSSASANDVAAFPTLTVLPIAPLLARAIHEVFEDGSVTSMFNGAA